MWCFNFWQRKTRYTFTVDHGCACCATIFSGYLFKQLKEKKLNKILLIATGALTNATTAQQGETIPRNCPCNFNWELDKLQLIERVIYDWFF